MPLSIWSGVLTIQSVCRLINLNDINYECAEMELNTKWCLSANTLSFLPLSYLYVRYFSIYYIKHFFFCGWEFFILHTEAQHSR